jgi:hypothetical protein
MTLLLLRRLDVDNSLLETRDGYRHVLRHSMFVVCGVQLARQGVFTRSCITPMTLSMCSHRLWAHLFFSSHWLDGVLLLAWLQPLCWLAGCFSCFFVRKCCQL